MVTVSVVLLAASAGLLPAVLWNDEGYSAVPALLITVAAAGVVWGFAALTATIDDVGLHLATHPVRFYRQTIRRSEIEAGRVVTHRTFSLGISSGWGYRGSLRLFRRAAWVVRSGPALELDLSRGRRLTVTVDDPEGALVALGVPATRPTG
jgi:hypothetical protein